MSTRSGGIWSNKGSFPNFCYNTITPRKAYAYSWVIEKLSLKCFFCPAGCCNTSVLDKCICTSWECCYPENLPKWRKGFQQSCLVCL
uniref:Uncharacterized protein n=1 Tax=Arundo donax TaxID=35708 RepID=A0A0A9CNT5_ARUDO